MPPPQRAAARGSAPARRKTQASTSAVTVPPTKPSSTYSYRFTAER